MRVKIRWGWLPLVRVAALILSVLIFSGLGAPKSAAAQDQISQWRLPERIPGFADELSETPFLIVDSEDTVHAFTSQMQGKDLLIVYSQWTLERGWTDTTDIILPVREQIAHLMGVFLDNHGYVHLIFYSGNATLANVYYTTTHISTVGNASAWSRPVLIGDDAELIRTGTLIGDERGNLLVVYVGRLDGIGLYEIHSLDRGVNWTTPRPVYMAETDGLLPTDLSITLDPQDRVHLAWTVVGPGGNGDNIQYAHLDANYTEWSRPVILAQAEGYEADWPSLVSYRDELFLIYDNSQPPTRWMRRSADGGQSWSDPVRPFYHIGEYGQAAFVEDSSGTLHMILGNRIGNPATHGMWHTTWQDGFWSNLIPIVSGPVSKVKNGGFDPHKPRAVLVRGNILFVVWKNDNVDNGPWFSYATTNAPEIPPQPFPTPITPTPRTDLASGWVPLVTPTPQVLEQEVGGDPAQPANPSTALAAGVIPAALFLIVVVGLLATRGNHKREQR